jgi:hypothetical protein
MMDFKTFFNTIRNKFALTEENVRGFEFIIGEAQKWEVELQELAYILATVWLETAHQMQPIKEYGSDSRFFRLYDKHGDRPAVAKALGNTQDGDGVKFCGRGYVQMTGRSNYRKAEELTGIDLTVHPEKALDQTLSAWIMFHGMKHGWFTGKDLGNYIDNIDETEAEDRKEYEQARRVINGQDQAAVIANYAVWLEIGLRQAGYTYTKAEKPVQADPWDDGIQPSETDGSATSGLLASIFNLILDFFKGKK